MMSSASRTRYPFTTSQWQELEHQALIFKYMISGMPIPPHLLCIIRRSYDSSLLLHQPPQMGWSYYQMGSMKKVDPEPGRCRRTDGKKWRCSKEAYPDSKYCERHMHRGRNRSRKPVEFNTSSTISSPPKTMSVSSFTRNSNSSNSPNISPSSSFKSLASESHQFTSYATGHHHHPPFLYPTQSSSRTIGTDFSGQDNVSSINNNTLWESSAAFSDFGKRYSNEREEKLEVNELPFFSETSGTMRNISGTSSLQDPGQLNINNLKQRSSYHEIIGHSSFQIQSPYEDCRGEKHDYFGLDSADVKNEMSSFRLMERDEDENDDKPKKVMHHFFDEWPLKDKFDSDEDKLSRHGVSSEIQLSISMPNSSDNFFFARNNEK